jgi:hypothetical protein
MRLSGYVQPKCVENGCERRHINLESTVPQVVRRERSHAAPMATMPSSLTWRMVSAVRTVSTLGEEVSSSMTKLWKAPISRCAATVRHW